MNSDIFTITGEDFHNGEKKFKCIGGKNNDFGYLKKYIGSEKISRLLGWSQPKASRMLSGKTRGKPEDRMQLYLINEEIMCFLLINQRILIKKMQMEINEIKKLSLISPKEAGIKRNCLKALSPEKIDFEELLKTLKN